MSVVADLRKARRAYAVAWSAEPPSAGVTLQTRSPHGCRYTPTGLC